MKKNVLKALAQQYNLLPPLLKSILYFLDEFDCYRDIQ